MEKDPLKANTPDPAYELFRKFSDGAHGFPHEAVIGAASNLLLNAIRQEYDSWNKAEPAWDELFARLKTILRDHYGGSGDRKNVFPFTQVIKPNLFVNQQKFTLKP